jgi:hypothetical protein
LLERFFVCAIFSAERYQDVKQRETILSRSLKKEKLTDSELFYLNEIEACFRLT